MTSLVGRAGPLALGLPVVPTTCEQMDEALDRIVSAAECRHVPAVLDCRQDRSGVVVAVIDARLGEQRRDDQRGNAQAGTPLVANVLVGWRRNVVPEAAVLVVR